jgi:hypothetical protein
MHGIQNAISEFKCFQDAYCVILHTSVSLMFRYDKHNYIDETQATLHHAPGSEEAFYLVIIQMYVEQETSQTKLRKSY